MPACAWHINQRITVKTAGRDSVGHYLIMPFKGLIREQLLNGKACKSYIIHQVNFKKLELQIAAAGLLGGDSRPHEYSWEQGPECSRLGRAG